MLLHSARIFPLLKGEAGVSLRGMSLDRNARRAVRETHP